MLPAFDCRHIYIHFIAPSPVPSAAAEHIMCERRQKLAHTFTGGVDAIDDTYGQTALMAAAGGGHAKVVALLLDNGADADRLS